MIRNYFFINTGTGKNLGDRAMLLNMMRLAREAGGERIYASADLPEAFRAEFNVIPVPLFYHCAGRFNLAGRKEHHSNLLGLLVFLACLVLTAWRKLTRRPLPFGFMEARLVNALADSDGVVFSGGGYLTDKGKLECRGCLITGLLAAFMGKPVFMTGQGIGPIDSRLTGLLLRLVAERCESIALRDPFESEWCLRSLGIRNPRLRAVGDDAFSLPAAQVPTTVAGPLLAVHFRRSEFTEDVGVVIAELQSVLRRRQADGWRIRFFIMSEQQDLEVAAINELFAPDLTDFEVFRSSDPREIKASIAQCDAAIGIAYHFLLFALTTGVPVIGLFGGEYYRQKIEGLFRWFGVVDWTLNFHLCDAEALDHRLTRMAERKHEIGRELKLRSQRLALDHANFFRILAQT